jgi:integrase
LTIEALRRYAGSDDKIDVDLANSFIAELAKRKKFGRSELVYAYAIKGLFEFVGDPRAEQINIPRPSEPILDSPPFLYPEDVELLISKANDVLGSEVFSPAIAVSYDLALRFGECANLKRADFSRNTLMVKVVREKQKQPMQQVLKLSPNVAEILIDYLDKRRDKEPWLFVTDKQHRQLSINQQKMFPILCERLGIRDRATGAKPTWHILRHTRLTWMVAEGKSIAEVAKFAGHASIASTLKYLNLCTFYGLGAYAKLREKV